MAVSGRCVRALLALVVAIGVAPPCPLRAQDAPVVMGNRTGPVWTQTSTNSATPPGIFGAGCAKGDNIFAMFGGVINLANRSSYVVNKNLWFYSINASSWFSVGDVERAPAAGIGTTVLVSNPKVTIIGGGGGDIAEFNSLRPMILWYIDADGWHDASSPTIGNGPPNLAFHTATHYGDKAIVYGGATMYSVLYGHDEVPRYSSTLNTVTWVLDIPTLTWHKLLATEAPSPRLGHIAVPMQGKLLVYGGAQLSDSTYNPIRPPSPGGLYSLDLAALNVSEADSSSFSWTYLNASVPADPQESVGGNGLFLLASNSPPPLAFGNAVAINDDQMLLLFGLLDNRFVANRYVYTVSTQSWSVIHASNQTQGFPRSFAMVTYLRGLVLVYGGVAFLQVADHLQTYSVEQDLWLQPQTNAYPNPRVQSSALRVGNLTYVYGGFGSADYLSDLWRYSHLTRTWSLLVRETPLAPPGLSNCLLFVFPDDPDTLVIYGGSGLAGPSTAFWAISLANRAWSVFEPPSPSRKLSAPATVAYTSSAGVPQIWQYGGYTVNVTRVFPVASFSLVLFDDLYVANVSRNLNQTRWTKIERIAGAVWPPALYNGNAAHIESAGGRQTIYLSGGLTSNNATAAMSDVYAYSVASRTWTLIQQIQAPAPTFSGSLIPVSDRLLLRYGGATNASSSAASFYNPAGETLSASTLGHILPNATIRWETVNASGAQPRAGFATTSVGSEVSVFFGEQGELQPSDASIVLNLKLACRPGHQSKDYPVVPCTPCPVGFFSAVYGSPCVPCPAGITTSGSASALAEDCNRCLYSPCHEGTCIVRFGRQICQCPAGFFGERCQVNIWPYLGASLLLSSIILGVIIYCLRKSRRRARVATKNVELQKLLLDEQQHTLEEYERAWYISPNQLNLHKVIGTGGFADVWLADYGDHRVAVKQVKSALLEFDMQAHEDFQAEIRNLRTLRHVNIVFFYGGGVFENLSPFLVCEYMDRGSLLDVLGNDLVELSEEQRLSFLRDTASGMCFLHGTGRMHRDLKSPNLLVSQKWVVKIADFGTAKLVQRLEAQTEAPGTVAALGSDPPDLLTRGVGTPLWTAPEILDDKHYDLSVDVFSFAIVMWEVLTRKLPYEEYKTMWALREKVIQGVRPTMPDSCDYGYARLMQQCWAGKPSHRPTFENIVPILAELKCTMNEHSV